nr:MAG TPA: hypothetical protein [Caudoviricetes sp.]
MPGVIGSPRLAWLNRSGGRGGPQAALHTLIVPLPVSQVPLIHVAVIKVSLPKTRGARLTHFKQSRYRGARPTPTTGAT